MIWRRWPKQRSLASFAETTVMSCPSSHSPLHSAPSNSEDSWVVFVLFVRVVCVGNNFEKEKSKRI